MLRQQIFAARARGDSSCPQLLTIIEAGPHAYPETLSHKAPPGETTAAPEKEVEHRHIETQDHRGTSTTIATPHTTNELPSCKHSFQARVGGV